MIANLFKPLRILLSMVVALRNMGWLSEISNRKDHQGENLKRYLAKEETKKSSKLGILSFETAKTMSMLVSLYRSLSDKEISRVKNEVLGSEGIAYLNSTDENFLWSLACAEKLEDLDKAATVVTRFNQKCGDPSLNHYDIIYSDLKLGTIDVRKLEYGSRHTEKMVEKMEKLIGATSALYSAVEGLTELEVSEKKLKQWKECSPKQLGNANMDLFYQKLDQQRKEVRHYREISLWSQTFDKSIELMARTVCVVYARICAVFASNNIPVIPPVSSRSSHQSQGSIARFQLESRKIIKKVKVKEQNYSRSGPIPIITSKPNLVRFHSQKFPIIDVQEYHGFGTGDAKKINRVFHAAGPSTVGGSGLALRYANLIVFMEKHLNSAEPIDSGTRLYLYQMLPENLKSLVKSKLSKKMKDCTGQDELLAEGWRVALKEIFRWLAPIAHNTIQWQMDRNPEKMKFELKPAVLLFQTLHFSDKEKTEAAIVEVLVALSCIFRYESCRSC